MGLLTFPTRVRAGMCVSHTSRRTVHTVLHPPCHFIIQLGELLISDQTAPSFFLRGEQFVIQWTCSALRLLQAVLKLTILVHIASLVSVICLEAKFPEMEPLAQMVYVGIFKKYIHPHVCVPVSLRPLGWFGFKMTGQPWLVRLRGLSAGL